MDCLACQKLYLEAETVAEIAALPEECPHRGAPTHDAVERPQHYTRGKIECIDALEAATEGLTGAEAGLAWSALKYLWRWKWKNGLEDLRKARWYLDRLIARVERDGSVIPGQSSRPVPRPVPTWIPPSPRER